MKVRIGWMLILMLLGASTLAQSPEEAVTYASFQYINYIATSQAKVYFASTNGIIVFNKIENRWEPPLPSIAGLLTNDIKRIWVDRFDERLFAEVASSIYEYNLTFERWLPATGSPTATSDDKHIGAPETLLPPFGFNYLGNGNMVDPDGRTFQITDVVDDGAGNLWIGTWGYGPAKAGVGSPTMETMPYGLLQSPVYTLLEEDTLLWSAGPVLNSRRTGITGFDRDNNEFFYIETGINPDLPAVDINCLEGNNTYLFVGSANGLYVVDRGTQRVDKRIDRRRGFADDNIVSLKAAGNDTLFVGTTSGLLLYRPGTDSISYIFQRQFFNRIIYDMALVDNYLWIASNVGAFRLALDSGKLQKYQDHDLVIFNRVFDVHLYDHYIWLASDNGLVRLDLETGETRPFRISSQKLDSRALAINDRIAAVASERGVTFIYLGEEPFHSRDFTTDDGLASNYVYSLLFDGDYLWVGTDRGLTRFLWNDVSRLD